jgi:hypothetical protein
LEWREISLVDYRVYRQFCAEEDSGVSGEEMKKVNGERIEKTLKIVSIFTVMFCSALLLPQVRNFIIEIGEKIIGKKLNHNMYMKELLANSLFIILLSCVFLTLLMQKNKTIFIQNIINKNGKKIFIFASAGIVAMSIIVRIVMYIKCRSLWLDEAMLAASIVNRNFFELLVPPLLYHQSAPVLYVITIKFVGSIFGYSESSLRIFSLFSFLGLLVCEILLLKKAFSFDNFKVSVVVALTALSPSYIDYSNELKPYMGDAFFVILAFLLYFYYNKGKIKLLILTAIYILLLGFSTPVIFFIGGILLKEFIAEIFNKNKRQILFIVLSGIVVLVVFGLYYYWWLSPESDFMKVYWGMPNIWQLKNILSIGSWYGSPFTTFFIVSFAFLGIYSLIKSKNKIATSVALSLLLVFLASSMGYWPMTKRLWLFLPVISLFFAPCGIEFIRRKIEYKSVVETMEIFVFSVLVILLSVNCLKYTGDEMYTEGHEVKPLISYVQKNIREDEMFYVPIFAIPAFAFYNSYNTVKIGNVKKENIINGELIEFQSILENKKTYIIFQNWGDGTDKNPLVLRNYLQNYGTLTEIMNVYNTILYYFEVNESNDKEN